MPLHGGKLAAKALKEAGVEVIFTLSGGHIMPLYDGCIDEGIKIVDVRHDQAAVHAADSWAWVGGVLIRHFGGDVELRLRDRHPRSGSAGARTPGATCRA